MRATKRKKNNVDRSFAFFFLPIIASSFLVDYQKTGLFLLLVLSRSFLHSYRMRQPTNKKVTRFFDE
jgi:hypothetical protein